MPGATLCLTIVAKHSVTRMPSGDTICMRRQLWPLRRCCVFWRCRATREPACGRGAIANVLRAHGHRVVCSDLIDYGADPSAIHGVDFLKTTKVPDGVGCIVTNPPYMLANEFTAHALELCPNVVMLLRLAFLESERRSPILDRAGLTRVFVFRKRLPMMHREGWQ